MNFLIPQGIGDATWALLKVQDIAVKYDDIINIFIACVDKNNAAEARALEFVRRFKFISSAQMYEMPMNGQGGCILLPGPIADENGYYRYIPDGKTSLPGIDYVLMPNAPLERGIRIEDWLPEYKVNWQIMEDFDFDENTSATFSDFSKEKEYVIFYASSLSNNSSSGHNRNNIWTYAQWVTIGKFIREKLKCKIIVVGADYDRSYFTDYVKPLLSPDDEWIDLIGSCGIAETFSIVKNARFVIAYQSGIGIVANYIGVPTAMFWRQKGDSISPDCYISFEEKMAEAWVNPAMIEQGKYLPLIYGRHDENYIIDEIKKRAW